jgi:hypothetical protein
MRKIQLEEIQKEILNYLSEVSKIEKEFKSESNKISTDLPNYAYISRIQILNDRMYCQKDDASKRLYKSLTTIKLNHTFKDILISFLILLALMLVIILLILI